MVRILARYNPRTCREVLGWHLRDALLACEHETREQARADYRLQMVVWAIQSPYLKDRKKKPPRVPRILREG